MRFTISSFVALASAVVAIAQPTQTLSINPNPKVIRPNAFEVPAPAPVSMTNAKRFAAGLPPLSPKAHRRRPHRGGPHVGTRPASAPRAVTSPLPPASTKCNIFAKSVDGTNFGYLSPTWNIFGEYGIFQSAQDGALEVSFSYILDGSNVYSQLDLTATNGPSAAFPYFGAVVGYTSTSDDMGPGSYNYAYLAGTAQSPAGSPPVEGDNSFTVVTGIQENFESAIWDYNPATQVITAQWINTDGSAPQTHLLYANDTNQALVLTGDSAEFRSAFGSPYPEVTFTCVPPVAVQVPA